MPNFCHDLPNFKELCEAVSEEMSEQGKSVPPQLVEKDYWIMHCLWGLQQLGWKFHLKGGTSLSKGWGILERFSEDIDILIFHPDEEEVPCGKNQDKPNHIKKRDEYFDYLTKLIKIEGIEGVVRDRSFDHPKMMSAGIFLKYSSKFQEIKGVKPGILLEVGFDKTSPNDPRDISSWAHDKAQASGVDVEDNRANGVLCYLPEYTFVEKLQAISTKFRKQQESGKLEVNQLRHYYDIDCLLEEKRVQKFIGTPEYISHKNDRFGSKDEMDLTKNEAFILSEPKMLKLYEEGFENIQSLFYSTQKPKISEILGRIKKFLERL